MGRKEKEANPMQSWRRKEKEKISKARKKFRNEKISEIPAYRRDPAPLISEIYRLNVLDYEGRLNSDMKQHKKHILDQFHSIKRARNVAGLETIELVDFDAEAYGTAKLAQIQKKVPKIESQRESFEEFLHSEKFSAQDVSEYPKLPKSPHPNESELLELGLPLYSPFPYISNFDEELEEEEVAEECSNSIKTQNDLKSLLEAEYENFKESLND